METLVFETALGHTAVARREARLLALSFGHSTERAAIKALARYKSAQTEAPEAYARVNVESIEPGDDAMVDLIHAFANGEPTDFSELQIDGSHLTDFGRKVTAACRRIPYGETRTYGQLAEQAGRPGAARAVGSVMARNRWPLVVPCHRVVPSSGKLGGFSAPQGVSMKKRLLEMEQAGLLIS